MIITNLRTAHLSTPMGYAFDPPVLTWEVSESTGKKQASARIIVADDPALTHILHDSGEGDFSSLGYALPMPLEPRTRYWWQVTVTADDGDSASASFWFETGKLDEPWQGQWIAMEGDAHPLLRRRFALAKPVVQARLYICGLGLYEASINGQPVTDEHFAPFYDSYQYLIQYQTWDVTDTLRTENELQVMLGGGWYCGRFGFEYPHGKLYGEKMQLLAELHVAYEDGTTEVIVSDESWQCQPSPILESSIYDGEVYDARLLAAESWQKACLVPPPAGRLVERISPPVQVTEELPGTLIHTPKNEKVLDFGQVVTGWATFRCRLPEGKQVYLQYGELLQNDCFYRDNLRSAKAEYTYTSNGHDRLVRPHFTFYGFRYVKVEGMTDEEILAANFTAQAIHSNLPFTGSFETRDPRINRLIANALWSQRDNFLDIPTDCPQRDERMGWTGDAQAFCATASYNMYTPAFYRKYLINMRAEQSGYGGSVPHVVPDSMSAVNALKLKENPTLTFWPQHGSCAWGDAGAIIPWTIYRFFGDRTLLKETYPGMKAWVDWIRSQDEKLCGNSRIWSSGFHFADWLSLDNPDKDSCFGGTNNAYVATAYYFYSTTLTAWAARELGLMEDAERYTQLAEEVRTAFRQKYFAKGSCAIQTQTALVLALAWHLAPEERRPITIQQLKERLDARSVHLDTGFVGTSLLLPVLSDNGLHDYAVTLLLQEDYPSWLYEVKMGATTIWERWNSVMPDGLVSDTGMNSMNHYTYGSVVGWMYTHLAGLRFDEQTSGFRQAVISPLPDPRLQQIRCQYHSASGTYAVAWHYQQDTIRYDITIPFNCTARVTLPGMAEQLLEAGVYHFDGKA